MNRLLYGLGTSSRYRRTTVLAVAWLVALNGTLVSTASERSPTERSFNGTCIAKYCLKSTDQTKMTDIVNSLGGKLQHVLCYYDKTSKVYLRFIDAAPDKARSGTLGEMQLGLDPICTWPNHDPKNRKENHGTLKSPLPELRTTEGLALGDPEIKAIELYGKPHYKSDADPSASRDKKNPDSGISYYKENSVIGMTIYLKNKKVVGIRLMNIP
jgi:hypothetical protein